MEQDTVELEHKEDFTLGQFIGYAWVEGFTHGIGPEGKLIEEDLDQLAIDVIDRATNEDWPSPSLLAGVTHALVDACAVGAIRLSGVELCDDPAQR